MDRLTRAIREAMILQFVKGSPKGEGRQPIGGRRERELFEAKDYSCFFAYMRRRRFVSNLPC